jgi:hypothetical protein
MRLMTLPSVRRPIPKANCNKRCVSYYGLPIYIKKVSKGKGRIMKTLIFHYAKNMTFKKNKKSFKRNQNPSRYYYNSMTNLKFQHKAKYDLSKILI